MTKGFEKVRAYINKNRMPYWKIKYLLSQWEGKEQESRRISEADYKYIKSILKHQENKLKILSKDQQKICNRIWNRIDKDPRT